MRMRAQKSVILKRNMKNLMTSSLPMVKKMVSKKINHIKSSIMGTMLPNGLKRDEILQKRYLIEQ